MATEFTADMPLVSASDDAQQRAGRRNFEHRFFLAVAVLFPLINIIGFAPSYYFKTVFNSPPLPSALVHAHGLVMTVWIILFTVQASLISAKRYKLHMTLGLSSIALAAAMIVIGIATGYATLARGSAFPGYTPTEWFMIPFADMVKFALIFGAAIYFRKNAANHKRLMLVTVLNFLPPSIGRLPFPFVLDLGATWFLGVPIVIGLLLLAGDTYRTGKLNKAFAAGVAFLTVSAPLELAIARTEVWAQFTNWLVS